MSRSSPAGLPQSAEVDHEVFPGFPYNNQSYAGGAALAMLTEGVYLGTFYNKSTHARAQNLSGYMAVESDSSEATMGAVVELNRGVSNHTKHELKVGTQDEVPIIEVIGYSGRSGSPDPERRFRLEHKEGDRSWDMHFAYGYSTSMSLQCRLCRLEHLIDCYKSEISHNPTHSPFIIDISARNYEDYSCDSFGPDECGYAKDACHTP